MKTKSWNQLVNVNNSNNNNNILSTTTIIDNDGLTNASSITNVTEQIDTEIMSVPKNTAATTTTTVFNNNNVNDIVAKIPLSSSTSSIQTISIQNESTTTIDGGDDEDDNILSTTDKGKTITTERGIAGHTVATIKHSDYEILNIIPRPNTLNVTKEKQNSETRKFIREILYAWRAKARCNVVPAERLHDLFEELNFSPTEKQINEMLQTAKLFARRNTSFDVNGTSKHMNGLTFGEFCVLAADLKRFRSHNLVRCHDKYTSQSSLPPFNANHLALASATAAAAAASPSATSSTTTILTSTTNTTDVNNRKIDLLIKVAQHNNSETIITRNISGGNKIVTDGGDSRITAADDSMAEDNSEITTTTEVNAPEVFLGGSCNPTTWRADVAIPELNKLGISFYNPQVSDWTPDLIELEHRAKEKAQVLFFVMDSETRASAGAIEAAHIAGQNCRHLVLVLLPYKPNQSILNEPISPQEYLDLKRNQQILRELVIRRGLPVLDSIQSGLKRTRAILTGTLERTPPHNIASRLISVRRAFDRVLNHKLEDKITVDASQRALTFLGYAPNLLSLDNIKNIIDSHRMIESISATINSSSTSQILSDSKHICNDDDDNDDDHDNKNNNSSEPSVIIRNIKKDTNDTFINFDEFCMLTSYLSILQQEILESGCISPIKGTNLPPPPIFLTNTPAISNEHFPVKSSQKLINNLWRSWKSAKTVFIEFLRDIRKKIEWIHNQNQTNDNLTMTTTSVTSYSKNIFRTSSCKSVPDDRFNNNSDLYRNRDSGTSSPQPHEARALIAGTVIEKTTTTTTTISTVPQQQQQQQQPTATDNHDDDNQLETQPSTESTIIHCSSSSSCIPPPSSPSSSSSPPPPPLQNLPPIIPNTTRIDKKTKISLNIQYYTTEEDESDSNDSVFSSGSSIDSILGGNDSGHEHDQQHLNSDNQSLQSLQQRQRQQQQQQQQQIQQHHQSQHDQQPILRRPVYQNDIRDLYLGGSCMLRTKWRQDYVIPLLKTKGISYHLPKLHESICATLQNGEFEQDLNNLNNNGNIINGGNGQSTSMMNINDNKSNPSELPKKRNRILFDECNNISLSSPPQSSSAQIRSPTNGDTSITAALHLHSNNSSHHLPHQPSNTLGRSMFNPDILDSSRVLLFVITNETRSLAPMTLAAHCIGFGYNVVLCVQMLPDFCVIGNDRLTTAAIKDYNRGRSYLIDLAKRQGIPVFSDLKQTIDCAIEKIKTCNSRNSI